jgi:hypothetical protein
MTMKYIWIGLASVAAISFAFDSKPLEREGGAPETSPSQVLAPWNWKWERKTASLDGQVYRQIMISRYKDTLRDSRSAQFREVVVNPDGSISGLVNAKNGFGGMSGWVEFRYGS